MDISTEKFNSLQGPTLDWKLWSREIAEMLTASRPLLCWSSKNSSSGGKLARFWDRNGFVRRLLIAEKITCCCMCQFAVSQGLSAAASSGIFAMVRSGWTKRITRAARYSTNGK